MEEVNEVDRSKCKGCSKHVRKIIRRSKCSLCNHTVCSFCKLRVSYTFTDSFFRRSYCYPCYLTVEMSKIDSIPSTDLLPKLPTELDVIFIKFRDLVSINLSIKNCDPESDYLLGNQIGKGSFSQIFSVVCRLTSEYFAAKKMEPMNQQEKNLFINEFIITKVSDHPNIIKYYHIYQHCNIIWIIMERMDFTITNMLISKVQIPNRILNYIFIEILKAVKYMHSQHRIHRDIKSDNVLINRKGEVKMADMGFAVQLTQEKSNRLTLAGTPCWIAPEILLHERYNEMVDIWSLGILLIELLEGEPPNLRRKQQYIFEKIKNEYVGLEKPDLVDPGYVKAVERCLQKEPANRASADELMNDPVFANIATKEEAASFFNNFLLG